MKYPVLPICVFWSLMLCSSAHAATVSTLPDVNAPTKINTIPISNELSWAALAFWGRTANNTLYQVMELNPGGLLDETLYSAELSRRLSPNNPVRNFFRRVLFANSAELNANFTYRDDLTKTIYEVNPYFSVRWGKFPWDKYLVNSFAVGEGISYDSSVPLVEIDNTRKGNTKRLLNFLIFEVTFAPPSHPQLELVARIHHRSGIFGLYGAKNSGSSAVGLGIRYRF